MKQKFTFLLTLLKINPKWFLYSRLSIENLIEMISIDACMIFACCLEFTKVIHGLTVRQMVVVVVAAALNAVRTGLYTKHFSDTRSHGYRKIATQWNWNTQN